MSKTTKTPSIVASLSVLACLLLYSPGEARAIVNPLETPNNRMGIHISDVSDIPAAADLVNSNGGEWGYVTVVIREDQRELAQWQHFFDELRRKKLIPIVRIATRSEGPVWVRPLPEDAPKWAEFLNALNWVIKNRYVVLFNEPNHAKEWGGFIDPVHYAQTTKVYRDVLKERSVDFFVLPAGVDISADSNNRSLNPETFYKAIYETHPEYFTQFDGWTVHAYPNPNFSSPPTRKGRNSIWGYAWERDLLTTYGLDAKTPLFITETGWIHNQHGGEGLASETIGDYLKQSARSAWLDPQIVAITPFILRYNAEPFASFSWLDGEMPLPQFTHYQAITKIKGLPERHDEAVLVDTFLPETLSNNTDYRIGIRLLNNGQSIWDAQNVLLTINDPEKLITNVSQITSTKPGETIKIWLDMKTPPAIKENTVSIALSLDDKPILETIDYTFATVERMGIILPLKLWLERWFYEREFIGNRDGYVA